MTDFTEFLRNGSEAAGGGSAAGILLRVSVLMLAASAIAFALRRASAALRHLVWTLSLGGALLIPLCTVALPSWQWAVLPPRPARWVPPPSAEAKCHLPQATMPPAQTSKVRPVEQLEPASAPAASVGGQSPGVNGSIADSAVPVGTAGIAADRRWNGTGALSLIWAGGSLLGAGWVVVGMASAWRITRRAWAADADLWQRPLRQLCDACGVRCAVEVRQCAEVSVPMTWGFRRPVILVPAESTAWSAETKRSVLLHELGHVLRRDCLLYLLGRLVLAVYWFHPLVWLAARQMRKTSEQAADDVVLSAHVAPPDYAQHLVSIASQLRGLQLFGHAALPMASRCDLEGRLVAILDSRRSRRGIQRKVGLGLAVVAMLFVLPCSLLRFSSAQVAGDRQPDVASNDAKAEGGDAKAKGGEPSKAIQKQQTPEGVRKQAAALQIAVHTVDAATGKALAGVPIEVRAFHSKSRKTGKTAYRTDAQGKATLEIRENLGEIGDLSVAARPPEYVPQYYAWEPYRDPKSIPDRIALKFQKAITIGGRIEDSSGAPIRDAKVEVLMRANTDNTHFQVGTLKSDRQGRWQCNAAPEELSRVLLSAAHPDFLPGIAKPTAALRQQTHVLRLERGVMVRGQVLDAKGQPAEGVHVSLGWMWAQGGAQQAKTDAQGRFVLKNCPLGPSAVTVQGEGFAPECQKITVGNENRALVFRLLPGATLRGRVVDPRGIPLQGVLVYPDTWRDLRTLTFRTETDKQGRWAWNNAPRDAVLFRLSARGFMSDENCRLTASTEEHTIKLHPELVIRGTVVDGESGQPLEDFRYCSGFRRDTEDQAFFSNRFTAGKHGRFEFRMPDEIMPNIYVKVVAEGYSPAISRAFERTEGEQRYEFRLKKGKGAGGVVLRPDGKPAQNATVAMVSASSHPFIENGEMSPNSSGVRVQTDAAGRFSFAPQAESCSFFALHASGHAEFSQDELEKAGSIALQPWGRLEGVARIGKQPAANVEVTLRLDRLAREAGWYHHYATVTDNQGRFVFDRVYPGRGRAARVVIVRQASSEAHAPSNPVPVEVQPGKTVLVEIGGKGRAVVGRIDSGGRIVNWTDPGYVRSIHRPLGGFSDYYAFRVESDGSFRIDDVAPGDYILDMRITEPQPYSRTGVTAAAGPGPLLGSVSFEFTVPKTPEEQHDKPLDLGTLKATFLKP